MSAGWVYVLVNPSMPGLVKIGWTSRNPESRASELAANTGVATPFIVAFQLFFQDAPSAEKHVHTILDGERISSSREFFKADATTAIRAILATPGNCEPFNDGTGQDNEEDEDPIFTLFVEAENHRYGSDGRLKNCSKALHLHQQAANLGFPDSWLALGDMYLYGEGVRESVRQAVDCFHNAIEAGSYYGYARLAHALRNSDPQEAEKAWRIFFTSYYEDPEFPVYTLTSSWYLSSYIYTVMALPAGQDIPAWDLFLPIREQVLAYIEERVSKSTPGTPVQHYNIRALNWLKAHP